jgi:hypothetical protein
LQYQLDLVMYIEEHTKRYLKKALRKAIKIRYACENYTSFKDTNVSRKAIIS